MPLFHNLRKHWEGLLDTAGKESFKLFLALQDLPDLYAEEIALHKKLEVAGVTEAIVTAMPHHIRIAVLELMEACYRVGSPEHRERLYIGAFLLLTQSPLLDEDTSYFYARTLRHADDAVWELLLQATQNGNQSHPGNTASLRQRVALSQILYHLHLGYPATQGTTPKWKAIPTGFALHQHTLDFLDWHSS